MQNLLGIVLSAYHICGITALCQFYSVNVRYRFYITVSKSQGSLDPQIHQFRSFIIGISGILHIRRRCLDSGEKRNAQCYDQKDRDKTRLAFSDLHPEIFV